jgi:nicotinamidase/pyrazinamidase
VKLMATMRSALLLIDVQKDFCPGGASAVPGGDRVVPELNRYVELAEHHKWPIYASRDWHPEVSEHFLEYGGPWPPHCIQNTPGATFHDDLRLPSSTIVVSKGQEPDKPGYSAFEGHSADGRSLLEELNARHIEHLYVGGVATDYCVKHSVLDALRAGFRVTVLSDAIAGVDVAADDSRRAIEEMRRAGARFSTEISNDGVADRPSSEPYTDA